MIMPAHIGFFEVLKVGLRGARANFSPDPTARRGRSELAEGERLKRARAQGLPTGTEDQSRLGDGLLSMSDLKTTLEKRRSVRETRLDTYESYRNHLDLRSPRRQRARDEAVLSDYVSKEEWDLYFAENTWFDVAMYNLFSDQQDGFYALLITRKSDNLQLKRIEGTNRQGTSTIWSVAEGAMPQGKLPGATTAA
jgi:hypothetical protein